jgi:two-component system, OmpR family, response regulator
MKTIFWVEDQYHWVNKFEQILINANFDLAEPSGVYEQNTNKLVLHKFVESASQAINHSKQPPDIVILDADMNGDQDAGLTLSALIAKKWPQVPVIFLSEHSGTGIEEKVFEHSSSQDFIAKHQQNVEKVLCWRIKALLRQKDLKNQACSNPSDDTLNSGNLVIDLATWNCYWMGQRLMNPTNSQRPLAPTPRKILRFLVENSPRPVTTIQMEQKLESDRFNYANYRQHIRTLRQSFEKAQQAAEQGSFIQQCKQGTGIITFGEQGAYCWFTNKNN